MNKYKILMSLVILMVIVSTSIMVDAKPFSITITRVACKDPCDETGLEGLGEGTPDFYAKVGINGVTQTTTRWPDDQVDVRDPKTVTQEIPDNLINVPVSMQIWDHDGSSGDDLADANHLNNKATLDFVVNTNTGLFVGDISPHDSFALFDRSLVGKRITNDFGYCTDGNGEPSGGPLGEDPKPAVTVCFKIDQDSDGDGLFDSWETNGIDYNGDGNVDLQLNTDPFHKDIFVEADWMDCIAGGCSSGDKHTDKPETGAIDDVVNTFANAPVSNPDGKDGITLHVLLDEAIPDIPNILFASNGPGATDDFEDLKLGNPVGQCTGTFGTVSDRQSLNCVNILGAKKSVYRYMIFGDNHIENPTSTGDAENSQIGGYTDGVIITKPISISVGGNDFIVTLGGRSKKFIISSGGKRAAEAGTFMHEFGHTLGLDHGGDDRINCKPNYLSSMNYIYQLPIIDTNRPLDYSRDVFFTLQEFNLNENSGILGPAGRLAIYGVNGIQKTAPANGPIDWNGINGAGETGINADVNYFNTINECGSSPNQVLVSFNDWRNLVYNFRVGFDFDDGIHQTEEGISGSSELTEEDVLHMNPLADLKVEKSVDKADAVGGDTLNYNVITTNIDFGKAVSISLTDTLPNSPPQTKSLPDLNKDETNTQTFNYAITCAVKDGDIFTNTVSVTGTNERGFQDPDLSNNDAKVSTKVHAPILTLSKTATASVNAGEAITYTISYQNTGSGDANNIVITDTLPNGIYYSKALDLGTGPQPNSVVVNGDGTRTLTWLVSSLPANSGLQTIQYTARPSLLFLGGEILSNKAILTFENANGCKYEPLTVSASTKITVVSPTKDPVTLGFWRNHLELATTEILARVQATDQRYDINGDGALSSSEEEAMFEPGGNQPKVLQMQLLTTYLNLATRRINAATVISSKTADKLGLHNVAQAATYAMNTLLLPVNTNTERYDDVTKVLDEINNNKNEVY